MFQQDLVARDVDIGDFAEQNAGVFLAVQDVAKRRSDFSRRQRARGHLVEQRLEKMEVTPIDNRKLDRHFGQGAGRVKAAETTTRNYNAMRHTEWMPERGVGLPAGDWFEPVSSPQHGVGGKV